MDWKDRIVATPDTLVGKPRIKGMRISVELNVIDAIRARRLPKGWDEVD